MSTTTAEVLKSTEELLKRAKAEGITTASGQMLTTPAITSDILANQQKLITLPTRPIDTTPYGAILAQAKAISAPITEDPAVKSIKDYMETLKTAYPEPPKTAEAYTRAYGAIATPEEIAKKELAVKTSTDKINTLNAQIQGLINQGTAQNLALEAQGAGITAGGVEKAKQANNREIAIQVLPLETQVLTEQVTLTGNTALLQQAQGKVDTYFKFQQSDAENRYNYQRDLIDKVFAYADKRQQEILSAQKDETNKAFQLATANRSDQNSWASAAASNGQGSLASRIMALDANSLTFQKDLAALTGQIKVKPKTTDTVGIVADTTDPQTNAMVNAFNVSILGLPAMAQKAATQTFQNYLSKGDIDGAKNYLLGLTVQGLPVDQQNQMVGRSVATDALNQIQNLLAQARAKGAAINLFTGNLEYTANKLGTSTNSDLAYIGSLLQQQFITYRRAMTGVAFSPEESKDYKKIFPSLIDVEKLSNAKIKSLTDTFELHNRANLSIYLGGSQNYDAIYGKSEGLELPSKTISGLDELAQQSGLETNQEQPTSLWGKFKNWLFAPLY